MYVRLVSKFACCIKQNDFFSGLDEMLLNNKCDDLSLMYNMVSRTKHGLIILKNVFASYVKVSSSFFLLTFI